jgi:hypothetical protein
VAPGVDVQIAHEDDERAGGEAVDVISYLLEHVASRVLFYHYN